MKHEQDAIYDIDVFGDGEWIDEFVMCGDPPENFDPEKWVAMYKRHFPHIAMPFREITIKYAQRDMR